MHITSITICGPINLPVKKSEWISPVMKILSTSTSPSEIYGQINIPVEIRTPSNLGPSTIYRYIYIWETKSLVLCGDCRYTVSGACTNMRQRDVLCLWLIGRASDLRSLGPWFEPRPGDGRRSRVFLQLLFTSSLHFLALKEFEKCYNGAISFISLAWKRTL